MSWEHAREPFARMTNLRLFTSRLTRVEVGAAVISVAAFIGVTHWSYPGVAAMVSLPTVVLVRVLTVGVLSAVRRLGGPS